jgi:hypothetical protein
VKKRYVFGLVVLAVVVAQVGPAFGAPSLASLVKRVTKLEQADRKLRSTDLSLLQLIKLTSVSTSVQSSSMTQSTTNYRTFSGSASCSSGSLVSGGVRWNSPLYGDYHIIESGPDPGGVSWTAAVNTGRDWTTPLQYPQVYAVCADVD